MLFLTCIQNRPDRKTALAEILRQKQYVPIVIKVICIDRVRILKNAIVEVMGTCNRTFGRNNRCSSQRIAEGTAYNDRNFVAIINDGAAAEQAATGT